MKNVLWMFLVLVLLCSCSLVGSNSKATPEKSLKNGHSMKNASGDSSCKVKGKGKEKQLDVSGFMHPQLLSQQKNRYSLLAVGNEAAGKPFELNKQMSKKIGEILTLPSLKQAQKIYPDLHLTSDPSFTLFDQHGLVFQTDKLEDLYSFLKKK